MALPGDAIGGYDAGKDRAAVEDQSDSAGEKGDGLAIKNGGGDEEADQAKDPSACTDVVLVAANCERPGECAAEDDDDRAGFDVSGEPARERQTAQHKERDGVANQVAKAAVEKRTPRNSVETVDGPRANAVALEAVAQYNSVDDLDRPHRAEQRQENADSSAQPRRDPPGGRRTTACEFVVHFGRHVSIVGIGRPIEQGSPGERTRPLDLQLEGCG